MPAFQRRVLGLVTSLLIAVTAVCAWGQTQPQTQDPAQLWEDFNHYVLIARPDLAKAAGESLLKQVDNAQLLDIVEASDYTDYERTLIRAGKVEQLQDVAGQLERRIQQARIERSRDEDRIRRDIELLDEGQRPFRNAVERLTAAGQFAAPHLLAVLQDPQQSQLHPYVLSAMALIGRPLVAPLSAALPQLDPVTMGQVAQVLAEIGYPEPLPYLKDVLENANTDPTARTVVQKAYDQLIRRASLSADQSASQLYEVLGHTYYTAATTGQEIPGFDASANQGIVWAYTPRAGLVPVAVPGPIYGDVLAMRAAKRALELNPQQDSALSLFLMANLRRENRLPQGEVDPSYPRTMQPAIFYAMLAGPLRLHDVLAQAINDGDAALALDAIEALAQTAGTEALVNQQAATQPLLRALSYPDRRVRFRAAEALANAKPREPFAGAYRVVPVLAESIRQGEARYALVIADDGQRLNELLAFLSEAGYEAFGGSSLEQTAEQVNIRPGVDLIVIEQSVSRAVQTYRGTASNYKLAAVPVVILASPGGQYEISEQLGLDRRVTLTAWSSEPQQVRSAIEQAVQTYAGSAISDQESEQIALRGLQVLRDVALGSDVYNIVDALPALTQALQDPREAIVTGSGRVLALIDDPQAQAALAQAALSASGQVQVALLGSLAESATYFGNHLDQQLTDRLLQLVQTSTDETAIAAARAHGALTLPTSNAVQMILR